MFVERLSRKAESAGGKVIAFPTRTTALSQVCHCGRRAKKPLSLRWHACPCGASAQRDLYSAQLARFVAEGADGTYLLDAGRAAEAWPGAEPLLRAASEQAAKAPARGPVPRSRPGRGQSGSHAQGMLVPRPSGQALQAGAESQDAVPGQSRAWESLAKAEAMHPRTPRLWPWAGSVTCPPASAPRPGQAAPGPGSPTPRPRRAAATGAGGPARPCAGEATSG